MKSSEVGIPPPPHTPVKPVIDVVHGVTIEDPTAGWKTEIPLKPKSGPMPRTSGRKRSSARSPPESFSWTNSHAFSPKIMWAPR